MLSLEALNCREGCLHGCQWTELFICSSHSSQESGYREQANSTQVGFHGFTLLQHLRGMWVWGARSILVGLFVSTPDIYQANRKCQWMPDVSSGYDAALEKLELLIHSLPPLTQFTSPLTLPLHLPVLSLLLLSLSSPALCGTTNTCQRSEVIGLNNGSYAHSGWNSQHLLSFLGSAGIAQAVFRHEKSSPVLHEWATYHTIMQDKLCMLRANALSPTWIRQASDGKSELTFPALTHHLTFFHPQRDVLLLRGCSFISVGGLMELCFFCVSILSLDIPLYFVFLFKSDVIASFCVSMMWHCFFVLI